MRELDREEIISFIKNWTWGTLIAVEGDHPYAVEVSYGYDDEYIYCGTRPGGRMAGCVKNNQKVAFKICDTDKTCSKWHAVIVEGTAEKLKTKEEVEYALKRIARNMGMNEEAFLKMADKVVKNPESNSIRIPLTNISGVTIGY